MRKKCFQVNADTLRDKKVEVWKCDMSCDRGIQQLPFDMTLRNRGTKAYMECLQMRQE